MTVLIADDDSDDQLFISDALKRSSFSGSITCVNDGNQVLRYLQGQDNNKLPDFILLDLNMPFKDGYQVLEEVKSNPAFRDIHTIILTSSTRPEDEHRCRALGCAGFYRKPVSLQEYDRLANGIIEFINAR